MAYSAPVGDIAFTLDHIAGLRPALDRGLLGDLSADVLGAVLEEAARFAGEQIAPLNRLGDLEGARLDGNEVILPEGWGEVYRRWTEAGWAGLSGPEAFGGQELPAMVAMAVHEMWNAACISFALAPLLTHSAIEALIAHAGEDIKQTYLAQLVSGEWTATMNLTEPQAGSDLGALRAKAVPQADGSYRISGTKIFITYGEHALTDNIIHMVLARLPDAPAGTKGISMFLVPKFLINADGSLGARNDVKCVGLEHKLGIHASPTCVMSLGEAGGAVGWLIGEENRGLACMFTMMNNARLGIGIQGVALAERATQKALAYSRERLQGHAPDGGEGETMLAIIEHPDVRRMLMSMRALTAASRALCYVTAGAIDESRLAHDEAERERGRHLANLLTPVAKAFSTDAGVEVASLGIQAHGGMGYVEETGAAQYLRDARITPIYEGTNGIQAIDLVTRKLPLNGGEHVRTYIAGLRDQAARVAAMNRADFGHMGERLDEAVGVLEETTGWMLQTLSGDVSEALAVATPYLRLFGLTAGGCYLARGAIAAAAAAEDPAMAARIAIARYFAENHVPETAGLKMTVMHGGESLRAIPPEALAVH